MKNILKISTPNSLGRSARCLASIIALLTSFAAVAADPASTSIIKDSSLKKNSFSDNIVLGYKSYNETGRFGYRNDEVKKNTKDAFIGRVYKGKHEAKLGFKMDSGWGLFGQLTQYRNDYSQNPNDNSKWSVSDPSLTMMHPDFYNDGTLKLFGSLRYYVPYTDRSKSLEVKQWAYYFDATYKISADLEVFNEFNPRFFAQSTYGSTDTRLKWEDILTITRKESAQLRWGLGQWTQWEQHAEAPQGTTIDIYPFLAYSFAPKFYVEPRIYLPVFVQNSVYDGSRNATWENSYFQIFVSASL